MSISKATIIIFFILFLTACSVPWAKKIKEVINDCETFYPVCGKDGITYYNKCQADDHKTEIIYDGACNDGEVKTIYYGKEDNSTEDDDQE